MDILKQIDERLTLCADQIIIAGNQLAHAELTGNEQSFILSVISFACISDTLFATNMELIQLFSMGIKVETQTEDLLGMIQLMKGFTSRSEVLYLKFMNQRKYAN